MSFMFELYYEHDENGDVGFLSSIAYEARAINEDKLMIFTFGSKKSGNDKNIEF